VSAKARGIDAYDLPQRVAAYDADMALMHPNRAVMVEAALALLPPPDSVSPVAVDLGVGTGYFTQRFLERYPGGSVVAIDGAAAMVDLARARLGRAAGRVEFRVADFRDLDRLSLKDSAAEVVFSSYALHHLEREDKLNVVRACLGLLRPGGWFLNADLIVAPSAEIEARIQQLRVDSIVARAAAAAGHDGSVDERFCDPASARAFLDRMETEEGDQPLTLVDDLEVLRGAGLHDVAVLWVEHREAVTCGRRPGNRRPALAHTAGAGS
jgi:tRNA (cmo5U34)-methyltransferase